MGTLADSTPAMLIKDYTIADGRSALFTGWTIKIGQLSSEPDQVIAFNDTGDIASYPHLLLDFLGLQILVRSTRGGDGYKSSHLMIRTLRDILLGLNGHPAQFIELDGIVERAPPVGLGYDDQDRYVWSWNARMFVEPASNALTHRVSL